MANFLQSFVGGAARLFDENVPQFNKKFIENNFKRILIVVILLMSYISLRYKYEECLYNIGRLKLERNDARYTSIEKWSILTARNRPELIRQKVAHSSVNLVESDERPVEIH